FDFVELKKALKEKKSGKRVRGASTISQQTAKNVFLWPGKSLLRKGLEAYFTLLIELVWGKERIMEVYLNVAEMGKGIYGAEAAAERLFQTRASKLGKYQSSLIAASLPNPIKRRADLPTSYHKKRASDIRRLMNNLQTPEWLKR
ncbi:MAG: monofunctional biosynthetic peptidoglycan transglycosylase, partial [Bacteroidales bacterium]|nr:monofunctional biosynthetic peptidoglycan transglycosylase [Bacteroidales bacterium]